MTRINVVPIDDNLENTILMGEYHEITRVYALVRNLQNSNRTVKIPDDYVLGKGHVTFFYNKLGYINKRYIELANELKKRNYNINVIPLESLNEGLDKKWFGDYVPTKNAINLNLERLEFSRARSLLKMIEKKKKNEL